MDVAIKFAILVLSTFGGSWLIYHFIIRPFNLFRFLFGLKPIKIEKHRFYMVKPIISSLFVIILLSFTFHLFIGLRPSPRITSVPGIGLAPEIDGRLTDSIWKEALVFNNFITLNPEPGLSPSQKTEIYLAHDSLNIYVAFNCIGEQIKETKAIHTPDGKLGNEDWVAFCLDTYSGDHGICFFALNPEGKQTDGTLDFQDGNPDDKMNFKWISSAQRTKLGWSAEMAIPFEQIRFAGNKNVKMRFKAARFISQDKEEVDFPQMFPGSAHVAQFMKIMFSGIENRNMKP